MGRWLPFDFDGPRRLSEVSSDLLSIAEAGTRSEAHVTVYQRSGGLLWHRTGTFEAIPDERARWTLRCGVAGSDETFALSPDSFDEAHLHTFDGADYYSLELLLADTKVVVTDAYNGLGGLPAFDVGQDHRDTPDELRQVDELHAGIEALHPFEGGPRPRSSGDE